MSVEVSHDEQVPDDAILVDFVLELIPRLLVLLGLGAVREVALCRKDGLAPIDFDAAPHHVLSGMHDTVGELPVNEHGNAARGVFVAGSRPRFQPWLPTPSLVREVAIAIRMRFAEATEADFVFGHKVLDNGLLANETA